MEEIQEIWTEKYRPKLLEEIIGQNDIVKRLDGFVKNKSLPHCLFSGPAGVGKTTCALAIARELFGSSWHSNFLELNASDERGIDTIRVKVKDFARTMPIKGRFKIVYLDEADSLTKDAQHALRRTMENYSSTCRFVMACNYSSKIIPPIQSRCAVFKFSILNSQNMLNFLERICKAEKLDAGRDALESVVHISDGDMRKAINLLQMASFGGALTKEALYSMAGKEPEEIKNMVILAMSRKFRESREILLKLLYERGLSGEDIIKDVHDQVFHMDIDDRDKLELIEKIGEIEFRITEGSSPRIQLEALLAQMAIIGSRMKSFVV